MDEQLLSFGDGVEIVRRHLVAMGVIMALCLGGAFLATRCVAKRYKSVASLNIKNSYFQMPLINDFVSGAREGSEMSAEKQAMIREALDDAFIERFGARYHLFQSAPGTPGYAVERELVRGHIEWMSTGPTAYQFAVIAGDPRGAAEMNQAVLDQVREKFVEVRLKDLLQNRASLKREIDAMGIASGGEIGARPELARDELTELQRKIAVLSSQYTPSHPAVVALRKKAELLKKNIRGARGSNPEASEIRQTIVSGGRKDPKSEVYVDLVKKVNYLDVVLELERDKKNVPYLELIEPPSIPIDAIFPKLRNFVLAGFLVGGLLSGILVGFLELRRASVMTPQMVATTYGVPLIGVLPFMNDPRERNAGPPRLLGDSKTPGAMLRRS